MSASPNFPKLPSDWKEESWQIRDNEIFLRVYRKKSIQKNAFLFIVHGQAEQSDRYEHFPHYLSSSVDVVVAIDLKGHGKSSGIQGHCESFQDYTQACVEAFHYTQKWMEQEVGANFKSHWFGHSLGGLITLLTLSQHPNLKIDSVTVSAPLLDLAFPVPKIKKTVATLLEPLIGKVKLDNELDVSNVSRLPDVVKHYNDNKLNHHFVTPRFFVNLQKEMQNIRTWTGPFQYPLMVLLPTGDKVVSYQATFNFYQNLKMAEGKPKTLQLLPGYYHESFNDLSKERPLLALDSWLKR